MARYIDADALLEKAWDADTRIGYVQVVDVGDVIDAPTISPDEVRGVAFWVDTQPHLNDLSYKKDGMAYYCSNCHHRAGKYKHRSYKFCPWCGAKMEVSEDA